MNPKVETLDDGEPLRKMIQRLRTIVQGQQDAEFGDHIWLHDEEIEHELRYIRERWIGDQSRTLIKESATAMMRGLLKEYDAEVLGSANCHNLGKSSMPLKSLPCLLHCRS
eukprot:scaffold577_cov405-Prasinococcus_capsulatus_cf.AAC.14